MNLVEDLIEPPVVGRFYRVPLVYGRWYNRTAWWPVMGDLHEDARFFRFPHKHYHLDRRFLREQDVVAAIGSPLTLRPEIDWLLSDIKIGRRKCRRSSMDFPTHKSQVQEMQRELDGAHGSVICPMHGLRINVRTGLVESAPSEKRDG